MRIFFDTEFIEDGKTIDLMSIGMIREDGLTYYAVSKDCDLKLASEWVRENVISHLWTGFNPIEVTKTREEIKRDILNFCSNRPEFWADYCSYDWIAFCQLFGKMIDLPRNYPMYCNDFEQLINHLKIDKKALAISNTQEHNALADAIQLKNEYDAVCTITGFTHLLRQ